MHTLAAHGVPQMDSNALLLVGFAIAAGVTGARLFKKLRIPMVVGYIVIGLIFGQSGFGLISGDILDDLEPFNFVALGLVGFHIGGSLSIGMMKRYGRQLAAIIVGEALGASLLAGSLSFVAAYLGTGDLYLSAAVGLVLGSVASATAPAATVEVLTEYRAKGPLTTTTLAIVALDDVFAVVLFSIGVSVAGGLMGQSVDIHSALLHPLKELGLSAVVGGGLGLLLSVFLRLIAEKDAELVMVIGTVLLVIGISFAIEAEPILAAMILGFTVVNLAPTAAVQAMHLAENFARPLYVLFFVMAGARLAIEGVVGWMWFLVAAYVTGRMLGKLTGAWLGARFSGADRVVRRFQGLCLSSQAGVAVGLSILAGMRLGDEFGQVVIAVVATTVFFFEIVGPALVKAAIQRSGEAGKNVTEEDLIATKTVGDVMDRTPATFHENTKLDDIFRGFSAHDAEAFPVVDDSQHLKGLVTVSDIRASLGADGLEGFLLATDLMEHADFRLHADVRLNNALEAMKKADVDVAPVVDADDKTKLVGMLEARSVRRAITGELMGLQADDTNPVRRATTVISRR